MEGYHTPERGDGDEAPSLALRIGLVLFSPAELFDRLRERPVWLDVLLLLVAVTVVGNLLLPEELLRQMAQSQLPADADPQSLEGSVGWLRTFSIVGAIVFTPLWTALVAGYLILVYNVLLAGEASYRQLFSATVHALVVLTLGGLLTLGLMVARGEVGVALALHLLLPGLESDGWAYAFLHGINVFGVWTAVVLGVAVSRLYPRRGAAGAAALLIGTYVGLKAIAALLPGTGGA